MTVRTRFAPSPTGFLHIGGVRTALFNWLFARSNGGQFILRIDDTDQQRHVEEAVALILEGFRWMDMDWDEGPEVGGSHGPYFQSQRSDSYTKAAQKLVDAGLAYRDYSTEEERNADREVAEKAKVAYRFRRKDYSDDDLKRFESEGRTYALRFAVPLGRELVINDHIKGPVTMRSDEIGDFVIVRPNGLPLYNFASVVDDFEMEISHIIRAEEHLTNTFSQLLVFEALADGRQLPQFAHVPYVAAPGSKKKLSKRDGAVGLDHYIGLGYLPQAMMNYLSRLGWSYDAEQEFFTRAELMEKFSLDRVNSSPASHDPDKLFWLQGEWMKTLTLDQKVEGSIPFLVREGLVTEPISPEVLERIRAVIVALDDRLKVFSDIVKLGKYFFADEIQYDPDAVKKRLQKDGVAEMLGKLDAELATVEPYDHATLERIVHEFAEREQIKIGNVVNPLRVAVTGQGVGPGLYDCLVILGRGACRERIARTLAMLGQGA